MTDDSPSSSHSHNHPELDPVALRAEALESLLVERGWLKTAQVDDVIARYNERVGPMNGARVVARAWRDAEFRKHLLADGTDAIQSFGFDGAQVEKLVVVENTPQVHNLVVCTLCSCYPWAVLGLPPKWYKEPEYRSRAVREPRALLADFGVTLSADTDVQVWDSSAEVRYMVLPQPPEGELPADEAACAALVSRDAMIGVSLL
jgi:nitrile hydratase